MNEWVGIGRITRDFELRKTNSGLSVANITIAIDRPRKAGEEKKTDYPTITVYGAQAENCAKYVGKGRLIAVRGSFQTGSYENKDGVTVYTTNIAAERVEFLDFAKDQQPAHQNAAPAGQPNHFQQGYPSQGGYNQGGNAMPVQGYGQQQRPPVQQMAPQAGYQQQPNQMPQGTQPAGQPQQVNQMAQNQMPMQGQQQTFAPGPMQGYSAEPNGFNSVEDDNF